MDADGNTDEALIDAIRAKLAALQLKDWLPLFVFRLDRNLI